MRKNYTDIERFRFFNPFRKLYLKIKADEEKKKKSLLFGILAIVFSAGCIGLCYPCIWLGVKGLVFGFTHFLGFFTYFFALGHIFIIAGSFGLMLLPYYFWLQGIQLVIMQFCLNRRFIGWIALPIWLGSFVLIFMFSIDTFAHFLGVGTVWFYK